MQKKILFIILHQKQVNFFSKYPGKEYMFLSLIFSQKGNQMEVILRSVQIKHEVI